MVSWAKITEIIIYIAIFLITYFGVEFYRRYSIKSEILDIPNERSSHQKPTPSGGGLVFVLVCLLSLFLYQLINNEVIYWSYIIGAILVATVSFIDDIKRLSVKLRFLLHFVAAFLIIWQFGYWQNLYIPIFENVGLGFFGLVISVLWIVWLINAFNFMDGIDGIASIQAITASMGWILVGFFWDVDVLFYFGFVLFLTNLGFILHNWQPAKIFMGDVGSAFLGYTFAVLPFFILNNANSKNIESFFPILALIFLWLFIFDTIVTLIKRAVRKERIWEAHREHLYQKLVFQDLSHKSVTIIYGSLSFFLTLAAIYCLVLNKLDIILISLTLMVTIALVLIVYYKNLLTKVF